MRVNAHNIANTFCGYRNINKTTILRYRYHYDDISNDCYSFSPSPVDRYYVARRYKEQNQLVITNNRRNVIKIKTNTYILLRILSRTDRHEYDYNNFAGLECNKVSKLLSS